MSNLGAEKNGKGADARGEECIAKKFFFQPASQPGSSDRPVLEGGGCDQLYAN